MTVVPKAQPRPQSCNAHSTKRECIQCLKTYSKQSFFRRKHNEPPRLFAACNTCALDRWNQAGRWKARLAKQPGVSKDEMIWQKVREAVDVKLPSTVEECEALQGWRGEGDVFEEGEGGRDDGDGGKENDGNISADELEALFVASFEDETEPEVADGNEVGLTRAYSPPPSPSFSLTRFLASDVPPTPSLPKPTLSNLFAPSATTLLTSSTPLNPTFPSPAHSPLVTTFMQHLTTFSLSTHLIQLRHRWHPPVRKELREGVFLELDFLTTLTQRGLIAPWEPLRQWLNVYAAQTKANRKGQYRYNGGSVRDMKAFGWLRQLVEDLGQIAKRERHGAVQGMKEMCAEAGMEGWEEQLETELVGMEMGVWRVCEGRGCLGLTWKEVGKGKFPELFKMHGEMEWRDRLW
jgi:hypothetical protein